MSMSRSQAKMRRLDRDAGKDTDRDDGSDQDSDSDYEEEAPSRRNKRLIICLLCKEEKPYYCRDMCESCYRKCSQKKAPCIICREIRPVKARGVCNTCYQRISKPPPRSTICRHCGAENATRYKCNKCWFVHSPGRMYILKSTKKEATKEAEDDPEVFLESCREKVASLTAISKKPLKIAAETPKIDPEAQESDPKAMETSESDQKVQGIGPEAQGIGPEAQESDPKNLEVSESDQKSQGIGPEAPKAPKIGPEAPKHNLPAPESGQTTLQAPEIDPTAPKVPKIDPEAPEIDPNSTAEAPKVPKIDPEAPEIDPNSTAETQTQSSSSEQANQTGWNELVASLRLDQLIMLASLQNPSNSGDISAITADSKVPPADQFQSPSKTHGCSKTMPGSSPFCCPSPLPQFNAGSPLLASTVSSSNLPWSIASVLCVKNEEDAASSELPDGSNEKWNGRNVFEKGNGTAEDPVELLSSDSEQEFG